MKKTIAITAIAAMGLVGSAGAVVLNLNLGEGALGAEVIDGASWNNMTATVAGGTALVDSAGAATAATVAVTSGTGQINSNDAAGAGYTGAANDSMTTSLMWGNGTDTVTVSGLTNGETYTVTVWAGLSGVGTADTDVTVTGSNEGTLTADLDAAYTANSVLTFTGTVAGGQIALSAGPSGGTNHAWQGIRIETVPEPSSTALLGLGGLALILRRRK